MTTSNVIPTLDDLRERLRNYMLGFAQHESVRIASLIGPDWQRVALDEMRSRSARLTDVFDDELLAAIASGAINPSAEASVLKTKLEEAERDQAGEPFALAATAGVPPSIEAMRESIARLALKHFGFTTLEARNSDSLDFKDVAVWCAREALSEAFYEGVRRGNAAS